MSVLGSKKKKKNRTGRSGPTPSRPASAQRNDKYAKYAGAVSNKSKRNYADLRLVSPTRLREQAASGGKPSGAAPSQGQKRPAAGQRSVPPKNTAWNTPAARSGAKPAAKPKSPSGQVKSPRAARSGQPRSVRQTQGTRTAPQKRTDAAVRHSGFGQVADWFGTVSAGVKQTFAGDAAKRTPSGSPRADKPLKAEQRTRKPKSSVPGAPEYIDDDYTRALNNSDFYGDLVEKYYIKYPEKQEERKSVPGAAAARSRAAQRRTHRRPVDVSGADSVPQGTQTSIAELAVKNRGTARKKQYARVVQTGKAKGSIPTGSVHRKVRRVNRRRSLFLYAASAASVVAVLSFLFFFWGFKVKKIRVAGETPYSDSSITALCDFSKGDNLMFIDTVTSEQQVMETLPYVETCKIRRSIPNSVEVNVTCASPLGVAETGTDYWAVVSTSGKILENISNVAIVSSSDLAVTYDPDVRTVGDVASARQLPVLSGLEFDSTGVGSFVDSASSSCVSGFSIILEEAGALDLHFDKLKYTDRGYEAEYDGRINIVLGDTNDRSIIRKRLEIVNYILFVKSDISEHDMGEITFLKNQTFFDPTYDISEEELAKYNEKKAKEEDKTGLDRLAGFAQAMLDQGIDVWHDQQRKKAEKPSETSQPVQDTVPEDAGDTSEPPQAT